MVCFENLQTLKVYFKLDTVFVYWLIKWTFIVLLTVEQAKNSAIGGEANTWKVQTQTERNVEASSEPFFVLIKT